MAHPYFFSSTTCGGSFLSYFIRVPRFCTIFSKHIVKQSYRKLVQCSGFQRRRFSEKKIKKNEFFCISHNLLYQITEELLNYNPKEEKATKQLRDFNIAIDSWATFLLVTDGNGFKIGSNQIHPQTALEAGNNAEALLLRLEHFAEELDLVSLTPSTVTYNNVMHVWAKAAHYIGRAAAVKAEELLDKMITKCLLYKHNECKLSRNISSTAQQPPCPTITSFNTVIDAYAKCREFDAGANAERVLKRIDTWSCNGEHFRPNAHSFSSVIEAHVKSGQGIAAANRAQAILDEMLSLNFKKTSQNSVIPMPNTVVFNSVLNAYANSAQGVIAAEKAEQILENMLHLEGDNARPTTASFALVIDCWAKTKSEAAPYRAEKLFRKMEELFSEGYNTKPNKFIFASMIKTWAESNTSLSAENANALHERMLEIYEETKDNEYAPSIITFNVLLHAWAKSSNNNVSVNRIFDILDRMRELSQKYNDAYILPDIVSYNTVLNALSKKGGQDAALKALEVFVEIETSRLQPDLNTYNSVLNCLSKSGKADAHEAVSSFLKSMEEKVFPDGTTILPDRISYTTLIDAISRSAKPNQGEHARNVLKQMLYLHSLGRGNVHPDVYTFTSVLNACAKSQGRRMVRQEALTYAIQTFEEMQRMPLVEPNSLTYVTMLNAICALTSDITQRSRLLEHIFLQCCEKGLVNQQFLDTFMNSAGNELCLKLLGSFSIGGKVKLTWVNPSWSSNS